MGLSGYFDLLFITSVLILSEKTNKFCNKCQDTSVLFKTYFLEISDIYFKDPDKFLHIFMVDYFFKVLNIS